MAMTYITDYLTWNEADTAYKFDTFYTDMPAEVKTLIDDYIALGDPYIIRIRRPYPAGLAELSEEEINEAIKKTWNLVKLFFNKTYPVYKTLIKLYADNESDLMKSLQDDITREDNIESTSNDDNKHVESDTPVSSTLASFANGANDNLSFGSQDKNSNTATSTQSGTTTRTYDTTYTIDKLDKVRQKMVNLYVRWYAEFYKEFAAVKAECSIL